MVAKRKTPKDERELPPAARDNPYATLSREELDAAWADVIATLEAVRDPDKRGELEAQKGLISQGYAWLMVRQGITTWSGGKPKGANPPIKVTAGPPISDYVIEDRR